MLESFKKFFDSSKYFFNANKEDAAVGGGFVAMIFISTFGIFFLLVLYLILQDLISAHNGGAFDWALDLESTSTAFRMFQSSEFILGDLRNAVQCIYFLVFKFLTFYFLVVILHVTGNYGGAILLIIVELVCLSASVILRVRGGSTLNLFALCTNASLSLMCTSYEFVASILRHYTFLQSPLNGLTLMLHIVILLLAGVIGNLGAFHWRSLLMQSSESLRTTVGAIFFTELTIIFACLTLFLSASVQWVSPICVKEEPVMMWGKSKNIRKKHWLDYLFKDICVAEYVGEFSWNAYQMPYATNLDSLMLSQTLLRTLLASLPEPYKVALVAVLQDMREPYRRRRRRIRLVCRRDGPGQDPRNQPQQMEALDFPSASSDEK